MQDRFMFRVIDTKTNEVECIDDFYWFEEEGIRDIDDDGIARGIGGSYFINQCTGLKDKNGKLIYEGDIVVLDDITNIKCSVVWFKGAFILQTLVTNSNMKWDTTELKIIGNIYENPELLEV